MAKGKKKGRKNSKPFVFGGSAMAVDGQDEVVSEKGGGEGPVPALPSKGVLQKQQRWEIKALKIRVGNLQKEKLKLSKKDPHQKARRKELEKQVKMMLEEQKQAHESQLQELQNLKDESAKADEEERLAGMETTTSLEGERIADDALGPVDQPTTSLELFEGREGARGTEGADADGDDMDIEENGGRKFKLGRKLLAKRMKKKLKAQKKRAWHLIAQDMGVQVKERPTGLARKPVRIKIKKRSGNKQKLKTKLKL